MLPQNPRQWSPEQFLALESFHREQDRLIENWSEGHHLNFPWVHSAVKDEVDFWPILKSRPFDWVSRFQPPDFGWEPWVVEKEEEPLYCDRMEAKFHAALYEYVVRVRRTRREFLADRGSRSNHYRWAAERVWLCRPWSKIARENHPPLTGEAVRKAVVSILKRIGIPDTATEQTQK